MASFFKKLKKTLTGEDELKKEYKLKEDLAFSSPLPSCQAFDPVQKILACGTKSGKIYLFGKSCCQLVLDCASSARLQSSSEGEENSISHLAFVPNEGLLACVRGGSNLMVWDIKSGPRIVFEKSFDRLITALCYHQPLSLFLIGQASGALQAYLPPPTNSFSTFSFQLPKISKSNSTAGGGGGVEDSTMQPYPPPPDTSMSVVKICPHPFEDEKALVGVRCGLMFLCDLKGGKVAKEYKGNGSELLALCWHPQAKVMCASYASGEVSLISPSDGTVLFQFPLSKGEDHVITDLVCVLGSFKDEFLIVGQSPTAGLFTFHVPSSKRIKVQCVMPTPLLLACMCPLVSSPWMVGHTAPLCLSLVRSVGDGGRIDIVQVSESGSVLGLSPLPTLSMLPPIAQQIVIPSISDDILSRLTEEREGSKRESDVKTEDWPITGCIIPEPDRASDLLVARHTDGSLSFWAINSTNSTFTFLHSLSPEGPTPINGSPTAGGGGSARPIQLPPLPISSKIHSPSTLSPTSETTLTHEYSESSLASISPLSPPPEQQQQQPATTSAVAYKDSVFKDTQAQSIKKRKGKGSAEFAALMSCGGGVSLIQVYNQRTVMVAKADEIAFLDLGIFAFSVTSLSTETTNRITALHALPSLSQLLIGHANGRLVLTDVSTNAQLAVTDQSDDASSSAEVTHIESTSFELKNGSLLDCFIVATSAPSLVLLRSHNLEKLARIPLTAPPTVGLSTATAANVAEKVVLVHPMTASSRKAFSGKESSSPQEQTTEDDSDFENSKNRILENMPLDEFFTDLCEYFVSQCPDPFSIVQKSTSNQKPPTAGIFEKLDISRDDVLNMRFPISAHFNRPFWQSAMIMSQQPLLFLNFDWTIQIDSCDPLLSEGATGFVDTPLVLSFTNSSKQELLRIEANVFGIKLKIGNNSNVPHESQISELCHFFGSEGQEVLESDNTIFVVHSAKEKSFKAYAGDFLLGVSYYHEGEEMPSAPATRIETPLTNRTLLHSVKMFKGALDGSQLSNSQSLSPFFTCEWSSIPTFNRPPPPTMTASQPFSIPPSKSLLVVTTSNAIFCSQQWLSDSLLSAGVGDSQVVVEVLCGFEKQCVGAVVTCAQPDARPVIVAVDNESSVKVCPLTSTTPVTSQRSLLAQKPSAVPLTTALSDDRVLVLSTADGSAFQFSVVCDNFETNDEISQRPTFHNFDLALPMRPAQEKGFFSGLFSGSQSKPLTSQDIETMFPPAPADPTEWKPTPPQQQQQQTSSSSSKLSSSTLSAREQLLGKSGATKERSGQKSAQTGISEIKQIMGENQQLLQERGEKLNRVADQTADLANAAEDFLSAIREHNKQQAAKKWWEL